MNNEELADLIERQAVYAGYIEQAFAADDWRTIVTALRHAEELDRLRTRLSEAERALRRALLVIEDEVNIYAPEHCDAKRVSEARARHHAAGGTLAYYAAAISAARQAMNYDQRGAAAADGQASGQPLTDNALASGETGSQYAPHHPPEPQK